MSGEERMKSADTRLHAMGMFDTTAIRFFWPIVNCLCVMHVAFPV